jgi:hypothetical protein
MYITVIVKGKKRGVHPIKMARTMDKDKGENVRKNYRLFKNPRHRQAPG